nr:hypothetical protein [Tanacetum cinerariifolium]
IGSTLQLYGKDSRGSADTCTDSEPLEQVQNDTEYNVFANDLQNSEKSESISNTCLVETDDSNVIPDSPDMYNDDIQNDQNDVESDDERGFRGKATWDVVGKRFEQLAFLALVVLNPLYNSSFQLWQLWSLWKDASPVNRVANSVVLGKMLVQLIERPASPINRQNCEFGQY